MKKHNLFMIESIFRDVRIIDDTFLNVFFCYIVNVMIVNAKKKIFEKQLILIKINIVNIDIILKIN